MSVSSSPSVDELQETWKEFFHVEEKLYQMEVVHWRIEELR